MSALTQTLWSNSDPLPLGGGLLLLLLALIQWQRQAVLIRLVVRANSQFREETGRLAHRVNRPAA